MGFIIMCGLVMLIALVSGAYYYFQDRKEEKRHVNQ